MNIDIAHKDEYKILVNIWEASVRATHHFLTEEDIQFFKPRILNEYLSAVTLRCAKDSHRKIHGFLGVNNNNIEMLFINPNSFGKGVGKLLLSYAIDELGATKLDVNEQNSQALAFYKHMGFIVTSRSAVDAFGKPYPLLHMELNIKSI